MFDMDWMDLWRYRDLFYIFAWRDIKVRYKQTVIGVLWVIIQPLLTMAIFTYFFGKLLGNNLGGLPYPIFVLCGLLFWDYFSSSLSRASNALIENEGIVKKVYFPRLLLPASTVFTGLVDFSISFVLVMIFSALFGFYPNWEIFVIVPVCVLMSMLTTIGLGLILSAANTKYRDVRYALPFFIQLLMFVSPVLYPVTYFPDWLYLNPMAFVINSFRGMYRGESLDLGHMAISTSVIVVLLVVGFVFFRSTEKYFADII